MSVWTSLTAKFGRRRARTPAAEVYLISAYRSVFAGRGTSEDAQIVLADLANYTGFFRVSPADVPEAELRTREGMRMAFSRINQFLTLNETDLHALQHAARTEAAVDQQ